MTSTVELQRQIDQLSAQQAGLRRAITVITALVVQELGMESQLLTAIDFSQPGQAPQTPASLMSESAADDYDDEDLSDLIDPSEEVDLAVIPEAADLTGDGDAAEAAVDHYGLVDSLIESHIVVSEIAEVWSQKQRAVVSRLRDSLAFAVSLLVDLGFTDDVGTEAYEGVSELNENIKSALAKMPSSLRGQLPARQAALESHFNLGDDTDA